MLLKRIYDEKLAQASYLVGCQHTHTALIVDPLRDNARYLAAAAAEKLEITHVTETHIHADFVSGAHDLAEATGAKLYLSDMGGDDWKYRSAAKWNAELLHKGSSFMVGDIRIDVLHTPGHTPEHLTFLVTDTTVGDAPMGALTGDFIFVGDVGRPDLLERAAGVAGTKEAAARSLFRSIQEFKKLPDYLQLWPGHGAGSACGKALGAMPQTTLGYERLFNWGLAESDEEEFVRHALSGQPDPPAYFAIMKAVNRDGPPPRKPLVPTALTAAEIAARLEDGSVVVDTRPAADFAARHPSQAISIPYTRSFLNHAGALLPHDRPVFLILADDADHGKAIIDDLALIGVDHIGGVYRLSSFAALDHANVESSSTPQTTIDALSMGAERNGLVVLDVRGTDEWNEGHIPGALHIPLGQLERRLSELPAAGEIAVHCQGGGRSAIAASILQKHGRPVSNVAGGYTEWVRSGGKVEKGGGMRR